MELNNIQISFCSSCIKQALATQCSSAPDPEGGALPPSWVGGVHPSHTFPGAFSISYIQTLHLAVYMWALPYIHGYMHHWFSPLIPCFAPPPPPPPPPPNTQPGPDLDCRGPWAISLRGASVKCERGGGGGSFLHSEIASFLMLHFARTTILCRAVICSIKTIKHETL